MWNKDKISTTGTCFEKKTGVAQDVQQPQFVEQLHTVEQRQSVEQPKDVEHATSGGTKERSAMLVRALKKNRCRPRCGTTTICETIAICGTTRELAPSFY